jgi:hypothetical protein
MLGNRTISITDEVRQRVSTSLGMQTHWQRQSLLIGPALFGFILIWSEYGELIAG